MTEHDGHDDDLQSQEVTRRGHSADSGAPSEWSSVDEVRARLSGTVRLRGPMTVRQASPSRWLVEGGSGVAAVAATEADAQLIAHSVSDLLYMRHALSDALALLPPPRRTAA